MFHLCVIWLDSILLTNTVALETFITQTVCYSLRLTLILLTWTKWRAPTNASKWRMGFNSAFKGLIITQACGSVEKEH